MIKRILKSVAPVKSFVARHNPNLEDLFSHININRSDAIIFDIGAHKGQTIEWSLKFFNNPNIVAFEPTSKLVETALKVYQANDQVEIHNLALSDTNGTSDFFESSFSATNSLLKPNLDEYAKLNTELHQKLAAGHTSKVECIRLDDFLKNRAWKKQIDWLKVDTQGFDYQVLKGGEKCIPEFVKVITTECQFKEFYENQKIFHDTCSLLYGLGFELYSFFETIKLDNLKLLESNMLFINKKYF